MTKNIQNSFYLAAGQRLTSARLRKNLTISQLAKLVGQQYNTIKAIEDGKLFSAHHFIWMSEKLNLDVATIIQSMEGHSNEKEDTGGGPINIEDLV